MKLIKESNNHKVWDAENESFGFNGKHFKYIVVDLRNGGDVVLRTNDLSIACNWKP